MFVKVDFHNSGLCKKGKKKAQRRIFENKDKKQIPTPSLFLLILLKDTSQNQDAKRAQSLVFSIVLSVILVPVFQRIDSVIHWINHYPLDKYYRNLLSYPVDSYLSNG